MSIKTRVERGAAWLDNVQPGWESRVDVTMLNLNDPYHCVCGQVFGRWDRTPKVRAWEYKIDQAGFFPSLFTAIRLGIWARRRGFLAPTKADRLLTQIQWAILIVGRRTEKVVLVEAEGSEPQILV